MSVDKSPQASSVEKILATLPINSETRPSIEKFIEDYISTRP